MSPESPAPKGPGIQMTGALVLDFDLWRQPVERKWLSRDIACTYRQEDDYSNKALKRTVFFTRQKEGCKEWKISSDGLIII